MSFVPFVSCKRVTVFRKHAVDHQLLFGYTSPAIIASPLGRGEMLRPSKRRECSHPGLSVCSQLRVVPEDNPTGRIDFGTAILRRVGHTLNFTIGYLLVLGSDRKHVGDMISKSVCIKVDR